MGVYDCACGGTRVCVCVHVYAFYVCVRDSVCVRACRRVNVCVCARVGYACEGVGRCGSV